MKLRTLALGAALVGCAIAPVAANAQSGQWRTGQNNQGPWRNGQDNNRRNDQWLRDRVDRAERDSNDFRDQVNRQSNPFFGASRDNRRYDDRGYDDRRGNGRWDNSRSSNELKDAVRSLDEEFERLRSEVDRHGDTRAAAGHMHEITHRADRVDRAMDRSYRSNRGGIEGQWQRLSNEIQDLSRSLGVDRYRG